MVGRDKDFAEEFFLHVVKTKQSKQAKSREKRIHKIRKKARGKLKEREKEKEKEKEIEKIKEKEFEPETRLMPPRKKPPIAPLPAEIEHAPEPPAKLLMGPAGSPPEPPKFPSPKMLEPPRLPTPPKFFEQEMKIQPSVNLGKINKFITDPTVQAIQCDGSFMPLKILKKDETIDTDIELNDREITDIINAFARHVGKEVKGPVFKASIKGLMISAVVSDFIGTKFMITKK